MGLFRISETQELSPRQFGSKLRGYCTAVNDGDGLHFFHTPGGFFGGWGWLREVPTKKSELKGQVLKIRIAGVDAPERAHFGKPAQPYGDEAMEYLRMLILDKNVKIIPLSVDQYKRVVARVVVRRGVLKVDVGEEMLSHGMAVVYEAKVGAQYGDREQIYRRLQEKAKKNRTGLWSQNHVETPMEYKKKHKKGNQGNQGNQTNSQNGKPKKNNKKPAKISKKEQQEKPRAPNIPRRDYEYQSRIISVN